MKVYRYKLDVTDTQDVLMPTGATLLHAEALGNRQIEMWAAVDPDAAPARRRIGIVGTGHDSTFSPSRHAHVGTVINPANDLIPTRLVWHVFDLGEHL